MLIHPDILKAVSRTRADYQTPLPSRCAPASPAQPSYRAKKARPSSSVATARAWPVVMRPTMRR
jgi:hypothetical protein